MKTKSAFFKFKGIFDSIFFRSLLLYYVFIVVIVIVLLILNKEKEQIPNVKINFIDMTNEPLDRSSFEYGKGVGRNAMLQYLTTNSKDTIHLEILLDLEDTLSKKYEFE